MSTLPGLHSPEFWSRVQVYPKTVWEAIRLIAACSAADDHSTALRHLAAIEEDLAAWKADQEIPRRQVREWADQIRFLGSYVRIRAAEKGVLSYQPPRRGGRDPERLKESLSRFGVSSEAELEHVLSTAFNHLAAKTPSRRKP